MDIKSQLCINILCPELFSPLPFIRCSSARRVKVFKPLPCVETKSHQWSDFVCSCFWYKHRTCHENVLTCSREPRLSAAGSDLQDVAASFSTLFLFYAPLLSSSDPDSLSTEAAAVRDLMNTLWHVQHTDWVSDQAAGKYCEALSRYRGSVVSLESR